VDVRIPLRRLPDMKVNWRPEFMQQYKSKPVDKGFWETGGVTNTLFAGARLGLETAAVGHVADDEAGRFCRECLRREGVHYMHGFECDVGGSCRDHPFLENTAVCLVLVDPAQRHLFCSPFQVTPGPVFLEPSAVTPSAMQQIRDARMLFMNGYAFQECTGEVLEYVCENAIQSGTTTFFDPGPFGVNLMKKSASERKALESVLHRSHVILVTEEEAAALTHESDSMEAGRRLLHLRDGITKWVAIKLGARGSLFFQRGLDCVVHTPGFRVPVSDTVGCGDSFAGAVALGYLHRQEETAQGVMELANAVGAITATRRGAGRNVAHLKEVKTLLEHHLKGHNICNGGSRIAAALELLRYSEKDSLLNEPVDSALQM